MHRFVSDNPAEYGDLTRGPRIVNDRTRKEDAQDPQREIQSGKFARQWISRRPGAGAKNYKRLLKQDSVRAIRSRKVGEKLRERMPWLEGSMAS